MKTAATETSTNIRQRAEQKARLARVTTTKPLTLKESHKLLHELRVHQIELEIQNDELRRKQGELESALALYDLAPVGYLILDSKGVILEANRAAATLFGISKSALSGHQITEFIFPEDQDIYYLQSRRLIVASEADATDSTNHPQGGMSQVWEMRMRHSDSSIFWAQLQATSTLGGEYWITLSDISERKQTEEALMESEAHYRLLSEIMLQGVVYQDVDGSIISMNPAAERILGKNREQFLGSSSVKEEHHSIRSNGEPFPGMEHPAMLALRTGLPVSSVIMGVFNPKLEEYRWISIGAVPVFRSGESCPYGVFAVFEDITQLKRAEDALMELNKNLETTIADKTHLLREAQRIAHIGNWELDIVKGDLSWSDEIYRIFGAEPHGIPASYDTFMDCVHPDDRALVDGSFQQSLPEGTAYDIVHRIIRKSDHEVRYVHEQCCHIKNDQGEVVKSRGTVQDVTDLIAKENDLKEYAHHIVKMIENERSRIARELHDELGQALTVLSFSINQLKHEQIDRKKVLQLLPDMLSEVDRMMESIRRICTALHPALLDELGLLAALEWLCKDFTRRTGIPCNTSVKGNCCSYSNMECCMAIFRVVQESLNNILKHADARRVDISLSRIGGSVYVEIGDDGRGMTPYTRSAGRSFGIIGMRERAHSLGATFEITSKKGRGTSVKLVIPCKGSEGADAVSHC